MIQEILEASIFVRVLFFAIVSVMVINIAAAFINLGVNIYMRNRGMR